VYSQTRRPAGGEEIDAEIDLALALLLQLAVVDEHDERDQRHDVPLKVLGRPQYLQYL
jgi:hypothetical protein